MSAAKFQVAASSPLRQAIEYVLLTCKIPPTDIEQGAAFTVNINNGTPLEGITTTLKALSSGAVSGVDAAVVSSIIGKDVNEQAVVAQWVSIARSISSGFMTFAELETLVPSSKELLAATTDSTAADVLLFAACRHSLGVALSSEDRAAAEKEILASAPTVIKWLSFAEQTPLIQGLVKDHPELANVAALFTSTNAAEKKGGKSEGSAFVKPSAEEIERRRVEKEKAKAEKEALKAAGGDAAAASSKPQKAEKKGGNKAAPAEIDPNTFLDIRVGRIVEIGDHPEAEKLFVETVDLGTETRTIVSGLKDHYKAEELKGKLVLVVCNMKPKPLKNVTSHGMVLCAGPTDADKRVQIVDAPAKAALGSRVMFGLNVAPSTELPPIPGGNKMADALSFLSTNADGNVHWKELPVMLAEGPATSTVVSAPVK